MTSRVIKTQGDLEGWFKFLSLQPMPMTVSQTKGAKRTRPQNRTIHLWFGEIAAYMGDRTADEVKAECNLRFGLPILTRDDAEWSSAFGYIFNSLSYPAKLKAIRVLDVPFTRRMTVKQLTEYMDAMQVEYRGQGIHLTDPELMKYGEMR